MQIKFNSILSKLSLLVIIGLLLTITVLSIYVTNTVKNITIKNAKENAQLIVKDYINQVKKEIDIALDVKKTLNDIFILHKDKNNSFNLDREGVNEILHKTLEENPSFIGIGSCWEINSFDNNDKSYINKKGHDKTGRFIPYWARSKDKIILDALVGYDEKGVGDWYKIPKETMEEMILDPILYKIDGKNVLMTSFVSPIIYNNQFHGITAIDFAVNFIQKMVVKMPIYEGKANVSIISNNGTFVANTEDSTLIGENFNIVYENFNKQLLAIKKGKSSLSIDDDFIELHKPIYFGEVKTPWQIRIKIPMELITVSSFQLMKEHILIGLILAFISSIVLIFFIRTIIIPLIELTDLTERIAKGDLTISFEHKKQNDEVGRLAISIENMINKLKEIIGSIQKGASEITNASMQISTNAKQLAQGANQQASSTEQISASIEEMTSVIQQNTENAEQTKQIAIKATDGIIKGNGSVKITIKSMQKITEKISVIGEIANKTDLLAINAAVEAARAGEHGKGFAVVASEIRSLAIKSQKSAHEIDEISKSSEIIAEESMQLLSEIVPDVQNTSSLVQEISSASREQTSGVEQINSAVQQLTTITQENASSSEELATSSAELAAQAKNFKTKISFFKMKNKSNFLDDENISSETKGKINEYIKETINKEIKNSSKGIDLEMNASKDDAFEEF